MNNIDNEYLESLEAHHSSPISLFFAACGGSTLATFKKTLPDDKQKRITAGIVVFVVALVSAVLASVAWAIPMGPWGYLVGPFWFMIMLMLERSILQQMDVISFRKVAKALLDGTFNQENIEKNSSAGFGWLMLRFTMIFFICYFNSEMIRVIMFKPEITAEIKMRQDAETAAISDSLKHQKDSVDAQVKKSEDDLGQMQASLADLASSYEDKITAVDDSIKFWSSKLPYEIKGPGGVSGITGEGPVAKGIRETISRYQALKESLISERNAAKTESVAAQSVEVYTEELKKIRQKAKEDLTEINIAEQALIEKVLARPVNGLAFMLEVLNDIAGRNPIIWAVFFMFFFIEAIPVLLKFFSKSDSFVFERAIEHVELIQRSNERAADIRERMAQSNNNYSS